MIRYQRKRKAFIQLKLTDQQKELIRKRAKESGRSMEGYIRFKLGILKIKEVAEVEG